MEVEKSGEALPAEPQSSPKNQKIVYQDVLSESELKDLITVVDDDDEEKEDFKISRSQHQINCKEWDKMLKYIKIPHYYIQHIMGLHSLVLPVNSEKLEFPIRSICSDTVLIMIEALVFEAAFRLGMKHSTEWTLESDVEELEAELTRACTTPLTDSLSMLLKSGRYLQLKDIRPSDTLFSQSQDLKRSHNLVHEGPSQEKRPCRMFHVSHPQKASRQMPQLKSSKSKASFDFNTSSESEFSPDSGSSGDSRSRGQHSRHRRLSPNSIERLKNEMNRRMKMIDEALKDRHKPKAGHRRGGSHSSSSMDGSSSDSGSSSDFNTDLV